MKLQTQFSIVFIPLLILTGLSTTYIARRAVHRSLIDEAAGRGQAKLEGIAASVMPGLAASKEELLLPILTAALTREGALNVMVLDANGYIVADTNVLEKGKRNRDAATISALLSTEPSHREIMTKNGSYLDLSWPLWDVDPNGSSAEELLLLGASGAGKKRLGTIRLALPLNRVKQTERKITRELSFVLLLADAVLLAFVFFLMRGILRPVHSLAEATEAVGLGIYGGRVPIPSATELGNLAESFNKMSEALAQTTVSKDFFDSILKNMLEPLIVLDSKRLIRLVNRSALELLGYEAQELAGQSFELFGAGALAALGGGAAKDHEASLLRKDGVTVPVLLSESVFTNDTDQEAGYIIVAKDMRERKKLEAEMVQSEKMSAVGRLASGVAHEINNPLGVILGFAQGALFDLPAGNDLEFPLKSIEREALRCKNLVQDLLTFSRVSKTEREPLDINEAVEGALSLVTAQARLGQIQVIRELGPDLPKILGNLNQVQQVVVNLASNALDAMNREGKLTLKTTTLSSGPQTWVTLSVTDTGPGIPEEIRNRIFEPFFTTKPLGEGTGLGLGLVHEIIQKHSGSIELDSNPGRTTFTIKFPVSGQQPIDGDRLKA